jgi:hypothetical protein
MLNQRWAPCLYVGALCNNVIIISDYHINPAMHTYKSTKPHQRCVPNDICTACVLLEMYILPVLGSGADADNGMAHLVTFICTACWHACKQINMDDNK